METFNDSSPTSASSSSSSSDNDSPPAAIFNMPLPKNDSALLAHEEDQQPIPLLQEPTDEPIPNKERDSKQKNEVLSRDRCMIRRTFSNISTDSKPDPPPCHASSVTRDHNAPRGKDVTSKHRHSSSIHMDELQSQQYFVNVPSSDEMKLLASKEEEEEEMSEDLNDDSHRPFAVLLEAVQKVTRRRSEGEDDEEEDSDDDDQGNDNAKLAHPDDISSIRSVAASAADSSPLYKRTSDDHQAAQPPRYLPPLPTHDTGSNGFRRTSSNGSSLHYPGPDSDVALLPRVDEHFMSQPHPLLHQPSSFGHSQTYANHKSQSFHSESEQQAMLPPPPPPKPSNGRRKIRLRLQEELPHAPVSTPFMSTRKHGSSILGHLRQRSTRIMFGGSDSDGYSSPNFQEPFEPQVKTISRGTVTVSWFDGTSSLELQEHVRKTVLRKLGLDRNAEVVDFRIFDESVSPPEEVLLCPFIPDGSDLAFRYTTREQNDGASTPLSIYSGRAPDSPSAAPSPGRNKILAGLTVNQLAVLRHQLNNLALETPKQGARKKFDKSEKKNRPEDGNQEVKRRNDDEKLEGGEKSEVSNLKVKEKDDQSLRSNRSKLQNVPSVVNNDGESESDEDDDDAMMLHSEDPIEAGLRQIMEMLMEDRERKDSSATTSRRSRRKTDKRQVIFVLANYFVLFLSAIAIFAEIQAHLPGWQAAIEAHLTNVQDCAADKDALFKCVESGDFAGLSASVILYLSRSVATRRFFLLGFDSPKKLWTVVYEALVTSVCWGFSYLFIRRGLNPDTRDRFLHKYWKDCVYGSLAGFNAAFLKAVLKNLIPQEVVEDALRDRQLKIFSWLPSFSLHK
ncbi:hypothetical protein MPSEU_000311200 [Mayamaea pseudoterrestris]|nr:hypothetical protein MPSEU_000311200 [Mayamaea pseudoterrestris]